MTMADGEYILVKMSCCMEVSLRTLAQNTSLQRRKMLIGGGDS
jgi:hypothetical protein